VPGVRVSARLSHQDSRKIIIDITSDPSDEVAVVEDDDDAVAPSQPTARPDGEAPSVGEKANAAAEQTTAQSTSGSALPLQSREMLRHCPKCPCQGCTLDREDPDPYPTDPVARRNELRRRSNLHNNYRDSVGRDTRDDPGPRKYRPNRAPRVQQRA
jgi:hypothetical protein